MSDAPPPDSVPRGAPAHRAGAARADAIPRMETVRLTQPDLERRRALDKTRNRLVYTAFGFGLLFVAVIAKLADATILQPIAPHRPETPIAALFTPQKSAETTTLAQRAMITDRNGQILAISLPTVALFADPRQIIDPADAAHRLKQVLPRLDEAAARTRLAEANKQFVYLERQITPREELAINALGIPGIDFRPTEERHYPMGRTAAQVLGGTDVDEHGVAGVEKYLRQAPVQRQHAVAPVDRRARAGGGARRTVQGDGRIPGDRRLRHRDGRAHGRSAGNGQPARLRRQRLRQYASRRQVQPRGDRHVRAGQHVQAADRFDGAGFRPGAHLGRVRRLASDPYRPFHHHRLRGQAPLAVFAGSARLFLQSRGGAHRAGRRAPNASRPG